MTGTRWAVTAGVSQHGRAQHPSGFQGVSRPLSRVTSLVSCHALRVACHVPCLISLLLSPVSLVSRNHVPCVSYHVPCNIICVSCHHSLCLVSRPLCVVSRPLRLVSRPLCLVSRPLCLVSRPLCLVSRLWCFSSRPLCILHIACVSLVLSLL